MPSLKLNKLLMSQLFIQSHQFSSSSITGPPAVIKDEMSVTVAAETKLWLSLIDLSSCGLDGRNMLYPHWGPVKPEQPRGKAGNVFALAPRPQGYSDPSPVTAGDNGTTRFLTR